MIFELCVSASTGGGGRVSVSSQIHVRKATWMEHSLKSR